MPVKKSEKLQSKKLGMTGQIHGAKKAGVQKQKSF